MSICDFQLVYKGTCESKYNSLLLQAKAKPWIMALAWPGIFTGHEPLKARPNPGLSGQAGLAHHYVHGLDCIVLAVKSGELENVT